MFKQQYPELALSVDEIAERICTLKIFAPGSYSRFTELTLIDEETGVLSTKDIIRQLILSQETFARTVCTVFPVTEQAK